MRSGSSPIFVIGISSPSGGGKTAVAKRVSQLLPGSVAIFFDDYDSDTVHPENYRKWLEQGADYNAWKTPRLRNDLERLKSGQPIVSVADGLEITPQNYVIFDAPLGYAHDETGRYIDYMVYIDTPLDVAMARRLLRDYSFDSRVEQDDLSKRLTAELDAYLEYVRRAYLEMETQIKPKCDLLLDGLLPVDHLAREIICTRLADPCTLTNVASPPILDGDPNLAY